MSKLHRLMLTSCMVAALCAMTISIYAQAPAKISGVLIELNKPGAIEVVLSVGAEDGVRAGDKLNVFHNGRRCGRVEIVKTQESKSIAKIIDVVAGQTLSEKDDVRTQ